MYVVWRLVTVIINCRFTAYIAFHNVLHGFWAGRGMGTASPEAKPIHQLADIREEVLYAIFLDLHKSYNVLERNVCLEIL